MTEQLSGCEAVKVFDEPVKTIVGCVAALVPEGPARTLLYVVIGLCVAVAPFIYKYYLGILAQGAAPGGSIERQDYDKLRAGLAGGNLAARLYSKWLTAFLDGVERFFGDAGMADRTLFPRAFWLQIPAPLWTAPAFDRCLLLALVYPIATIFLIWTISGHVGPAETALGLDPEVPGWWRGLAATAIGFSSFSFWHGYRARGWKSLVWIVVAFAGFVAVSFSGVVAGVVAGALAGAVAVALPLSRRLSLTDNDDGIDGAIDDTTDGAITGAGAVAVGLGVAAAYVTGADVGVGVGFTAFAINYALWGEAVVILALVGGVAIAFAGARAADIHAVVFAVAFAFAGAGPVSLLTALAIRTQLQGILLLLFLPAMILACFAAAFLLPHEGGGVGGPLLLFLGLLTLLNAPFDWASLGLTRSLLRRGLELGGWWPYVLALVDAALAGVIIALLALVTVIGVQAFDELAVHGGGEPVLPLDALFDGIAKYPAAPEYWWAYALLLSSMIPSFINLAISGMAFTRGIPGLPRLLLLWTPEGRDVPEYKRPFVAGGLTLQMFAGAGLGIAAQAFLAWGLIFHLMPAIGLDLLDMARAVACFDLPTRVAHLFAGTL